MTAIDLRAPPRAIPGVNWVRHDVDAREPLPFPRGSFDAVVSVELLEHLRAPHLALTEMVRVLRTDGPLVLAMPNYGSVGYRVRYLLTGSLEPPEHGDAHAHAAYLEGPAPRITNLPYPVLRSVLGWEGCGRFRIARAGRSMPLHLVVYAPVLVWIYVATWLSGARRRRRYRLRETNARAALLGSRHVLVSCRKQIANVRRLAGSLGFGLDDRPSKEPAVWVWRVST